MKKLLFSALAFFIFGFANAQMKFGVKAGLFSSSYDGYSLHKKDFNNANLDYYDYGFYGLGGSGANVSKPGVYVGGLLEFDLVKDFKLQPELTVSFIPNKDYGYIALNVPVLVKYSFFDKFYAMAGPALNYAVDGDDEQFSPSLDLGASYDIMENFYVEVRGDIGVAGYLGTTVNAGVGYRL